jgi:hypothetical protein
MALSARLLTASLHSLGALLLAGCTARAAATSPRDLATGLVLDSAWLELAADPPLHVCTSARELVLHHSRDVPLTRTAPGRVGAVYNPQLDELIRVDAELIGKDGSVMTLALGGISPGQLGLRLAEPRGPRTCEVTKLRLRADHAFEVSRLEWRNSTAL